MNSRSQQAFLRRISGKQLLGLFDLLPDVSFFLKDRESRFLGLNRRGCEYCGVPNERAAIGKTDHDFFPRSRADEYQRDDQAVMRSGKPIINRMQSAPEAEGLPHFVLTSKIPLRDERGRVIGLAGISRPVEQVRERSGSVARLSKVMDHLHCQSHEAHSTADLAALAGLSVSQFERTFRKSFGSSPRQYLLRFRVEAAARHLAESETTIATIAVESGFHDHAHFTRSFRQVMGLTPSAYRSEHQQPRMRG